jgi:hypothetical protein
MKPMRTPDETDKLSPKALKYYKRAKSMVHNAGSVYDVGISRGLLLALKTEGVIDKSTLDRLFKGVLDKVRPELIRRLPPELVANLGKGVKAPAAPRTRRGRR